MLNFVVQTSATPVVNGNYDSLGSNFMVVVVALVVIL